ncbi:hypothetical protein PAXRUDRAFT_834963 [Paxillus rubicundulus Ve08.2h10]|uniref:Homeobox domain-containing protein n=1 Tax=Paxillus rubicundulus Ve08.2h10 TaxID=930991 RepID=A0A0D0DHK1_9AGAM|nr:hypothetical protein PAXRUDRAFT_834963 [Paxillus rubicundulus Ve08.2h10]
MKIKKRAPVFAKEWQLAILRKLQTESRHITEEQCLAAVEETGLDKKWVKNWLTRQKSKTAARNRKNQVLLQEENLCYPPAADEPRHMLHGLPSHRSESESMDRVSVLGPSGGQASETSATDRTNSFYASRSMTQAVPRYERSFSNASLPSDGSFANGTPVAHATAMAYSRDPLCNRYPDFSQFFHPQVYERFRNSESLPTIDDRLLQLLANADADPNVLAHLRGLLTPHRLGGALVGQDSSTGLQNSPYPIAFVVRPADVEQLHHPLVPRLAITNDGEGDVPLSDPDPHNTVDSSQLRVVIVD